MHAASIRWSLVVWLSLTAALTAATRSDSQAEPPAITYEKHIRPILKAHCFHCHGEDDHTEGSLDLRLVRLIRTGGDSGPAIEPGKHQDSLLYQRIADGEMPPGDVRVPQEELEVIRRWIDAGAPTARPEPESPEAAAITEEERSHWAFQSVQRPSVPRVEDRDLVATPIDAFVLEKLTAAGLTFSPEADRATLARRAYFDLWGLPPTPEQIDEFVHDTSPDAWERLIDRLLASPRYGERWGRHWLDVAGYADSDGASEKDPVRAVAYKYRDWVIRAFNADKPYDEFVREQLAGDEILNRPFKDLSPEQTDLLIATGFLRMAPDGTGDSALDRNTASNEVIAETIKIVSTSLLGLSVGCAQCHSHRFDPIPHEDYYRLRAIFEPAYDWKNWLVPSKRLISLQTAEEVAAVKASLAEIEALKEQQTAELQALADKAFEIELAKLPEEIQADFREARNTPAAKHTPEQKALIKKYPGANITTRNVHLYYRRDANALKARYAELQAEIEKNRPPDNFVMALTEVPGKVPTTHLFFRGDFTQPRQEVAPGELSVLCSENTPEIPVNNPKLRSTGRRLAYAEYLTNGKHPLVGRVLVNRLWLHHFGRGIVATPADFGLAGQPPTHPELLDWLASELVDGGWRLKRLHKLMMMSRAYRQSSLHTAQLDAVDPENRLLGRMNVRRLHAEEVRDAILAVCGSLNDKMFGDPVPVYPDETGQIIIGVDNRDTAGRPTKKVVDLGPEADRRSIYVQVRRSMPLSMLEVFDAPTMTPNCDMRSSSTVAPQSLLLMNNTFVIERSEEFARRVEEMAGKEPEAQVQVAWRLALGVDPTADQMDRALAFLSQQREVFDAQPPVKGKPASSAQALASLCQALVSSNAFLYVD